MNDSFAYWKERAARHGDRAVFNLAHPGDELDKVTATQWAAVAPQLRKHLSGKEKTVLDFGCGAGRMTRLLASLTNAAVIGADPTAALIAHAQPSATDRVRFLCTPDGTLPLPDGSVDVVLIHLVLGGLRGGVLRQAVDEVTRVLRTGGLLVLVENTAEQPDVEHWAFRGVDAYRDMFPIVTLAYGGSYTDTGERISVMAGRHTATQATRAA